jgi:hypothetical protein
LPASSAIAAVAPERRKLDVAAVRQAMCRADLFDGLRPQVAETVGEHGERAARLQHPPAHCEIVGVSRQHVERERELFDGVIERAPGSALDRDVLHLGARYGTERSGGRARLRERSAGRQD